MKPIQIKPTYNLQGLTNVIPKDAVTFVGRDGEEISPWDDQTAALKQLLELLGEDE